MWKLAERTAGIDTNSPYSYLIWCRDFYETTRVVKDHGGEVVAFTTAYIRPLAPKTLMIWQQVVSHAHRGRQLGCLMVRDLTAAALEDGSVTTVEATVTDTSGAPVRTLEKIASEFGGTLSFETLFDQSHFPGGEHDAEVLVTVEPLVADQSGAK